MPRVPKLSKRRKHHSRWFSRFFGPSLEHDSTRKRSGNNELTDKSVSQIHKSIYLNANNYAMFLKKSNKFTFDKYL